MESLAHLVETTLAKSVDPAFAAMADHLRLTHRGDIRAIIGYGSALRGVAVNDTLLDFYVLTPTFRDVSTNAFSRAVCRLAPPNVYYAELLYEGTVLRCKYAALPLPQFKDWVRPSTANPYFWARFCQPARLLFAVDEAARRDVTAALCMALQTMYANAKSLSDEDDPLRIFSNGFAATYKTELRPENAARCQSIVEADESFYRHAGRLLADTAPVAANWPARRIAGKVWSLVRLTKAAFTFSGGVDYAAWKIQRHSGQTIAITDWDRRHPILTGLKLLPRLLRKGALR